MANRLRIVVLYVQLQMLYCLAQKLVRSKSASNHEGLKPWLNAKRTWKIRKAAWGLLRFTVDVVPRSGSVGQRNRHSARHKTQVGLGYLKKKINPAEE
jgi:hypothetical protein